ncbi:hypothetical protein ACG6P0_002642 [Enterococcus hirae]|uniref:hypothetical protein n=1 Tax=Enterococcus hirae TaxID=1354 RepID=UPI00032DD0CF|nr:hypothetical protein [Enterococcus hirae]EOF58834.1 hypothetical protein SE1_01160 [Enterococcus hirae EnGen0127]GMB97188.1 hypothetical protein K2D_02020 [Enterococcus hirae]GMC07676.1 hypothetical protein K4F_26820 [Enterococcus hirae]
MSKALKWLEAEADRLEKEYIENDDPNKTVNHSFLEGFNYALLNAQALEQIQLDDNQKIVLDWLKYPLNEIPNRFAQDYFAYVTCLFLGQAPERVIKSYRELSSEQQMQILSVWGLEQEVNSDGIN